MINVIYRLCERESSGTARPSWFSKEKCLTSFLNSVEYSKNHINKVIFVHDGPEGELLNQILFTPYEMVKIHEHSNLGSLIKTFDIASAIGGNIYFIEDDYLHKPESIAKIDMVLPDLKLVTGYDHLSKYTNQYGPFNLEKKTIFDTTTNMTWQTAEFCCATYAIEESTYKKFQSTIRSKNVDDIGTFVELNNKGVPLWSSIPGLSTQVDSYQSPNVNWEEFNSTL
jgi:hypothetical protein